MNPGATDMRQQILKTLEDNMRAVFEHMDGLEVTESKSLVKDFGADSLQVVEVVSRTMKALGARVRRTELSKAQDIGQLVDLLEAARAAS